MIYQLLESKELPMFKQELYSLPQLKKNRGRPKPFKNEGPTPELLLKRRRVRDILKDNSAPLMSWLHIAFKDGTLNQELFDLGSYYLRFRIQVLRHQQTKSLKLNCHRFSLPVGKHLSAAQEYKDAKAEENWQELNHLMPSSSLECLDNLL